VVGNLEVGIELDPNLTYPIVINATLIQPTKPLVESLSTISAVLISFIALVFGLYNFWWSNMLRGKIIVSDPLIYEIILDYAKISENGTIFNPRAKKRVEPEEDQGLRFKVPLIFFK
jgi:hypothetical protein